MKPLNEKYLAYFALFIGGKDVWLKAWKQMRDRKDWPDNIR